MHNSSGTQLERDGDKPCSSWFDSNPDDLVYRLLKRAEIRRQIKDRKSVQEGKLDRIAGLLEEAANELIRLRSILRC